VGKGSAAHLTAELLQDAAGIEMVHVPYPGIAKAKLDIISGEVNVGFTNIISMYQFIEDGSVIPLAITDTERSPVLPDVPTLSETYPGISVELWWGVFAPAGTPKDVIEKLNKEVNVVLSNPEMIETWKKQATDIKGSSPEELKNMLNKDYQKWLKLIDKKGLNK
jgi:tripartite-type tricarboxylate transporter receptor subunit TctC